MRANRRFACRLKWALPIWASPTQNRTLSGKVHELKARETSQEPSALGQMLRKNPFAKLRFALRFGLAALACSQTFSLLSVSLRSLACGFFLSCMSFFLQKIDEQSLFLIWGAGPRLRRGAARGGDILFSRHQQSERLILMEYSKYPF